MCHVTAVFAHLHLVLQGCHVSLLHQFVERHQLSEALDHCHDLSLLREIEGQLQSCVQTHLPDTATQQDDQHKGQGRYWTGQGRG